MKMNETEQIKGRIFMELGTSMMCMTTNSVERS